MRQAATPNPTISRILSSSAVQLVAMFLMCAVTLVTCFNLVWEEIHGVPLTATTSGLLNFLLAFASSVIGFHVGSGVTISGANQGITSQVNPNSLTVDSNGRSNGVADNVTHSSTSSMTGGPGQKEATV